MHCMSKRSTIGRNAGSISSPREVAAVEQELDPLEEHAVGAVGVLLRVDDVAAVAVHEVGDRGDDAGLVGTRQQEHRGRARHPAHPERFTTRPATRVIPAGATLENAAAVWLSTPGIDTERPRSRSRNAAATTSSADCHTNSGRSVSVRARHGRGTRCACSQGTRASRARPFPALLRAPRA